MNTTVFLRGNGGAGIGWGHISRLLALRDILKESFRTVFCVSEESIPMLQRAGLNEKDYLAVPGFGASGFSAEWGMVPRSGDILVLDGYTFDAEYRENAMEAGFRLVLIDDFAHGYLRCDLLINHAPGSAALYAEHPEIRQCCCGTEYALLRPEFYRALPSVSRDMETVFVSMGGADPDNLTAELLAKLVPAFPGLQWLVAVTSSFSGDHVRKIEHLHTTHRNIVLHRDLDAHGMRNLMLQSGLGLLASSTVLIEAWSSGMFPAAYCYTENQHILYRGAVNNGFAFPFDNAAPVESFQKYLTGSHRTLPRSNTWNPPVKLLHEFKILAA